MTGSISWGDLDSTTQSYINGLGGSDVVLPSYIKSTYIDSTQILSPTISAGTLNGTTIKCNGDFYVYDPDDNNMVKFIDVSTDSSSDTRIKIGRLTTNGYGSYLNFIGFIDQSQYRYIHCYTDVLRCSNDMVVGAGTNDIGNGSGDLYVNGTIYGTYLGSSSNQLTLAYAKNFCVGTTTTTSNAYCGFSSNKYLQKYSGSSERHKHNIHSLNDDLKSRFNSLYDLEVKNWTYNDDYIDSSDQLYQKETFGLIAEDVEKVLPEFVVYDNGQVDNYRDRNLINAMLVLIQEQKKKIDELELRISILEGDNK